MANTIDWGQGAVNNTIGWGKGKTNATNNWGSIYDSTAAGETNITGSGGVTPFVNEYSMSFDGVDEYAKGSSTFSELDGQTKATFSLWVKPTSFAVGRMLFSIDKDTTSGNSQVMMYVDTSGRLRGFISTGSRYIYSNASVLTINTWHHILFCVDLTQVLVANRGRIFVDGVDQTASGFSQLNETIFPTSNSQLYVAEDKNGFSNPFLGNMDEVAMWVGSDERANVADIYNGGTPSDLSQLATPPQHWWRMGDGDTWSGSQWNLTDNIGSYNLDSVNMEEGDRVTDVPPNFNLYSMSFDGVDEYFNGASTFSTLDGQNKMTLSLWMKPISGAPLYEYVVTVPRNSTADQHVFSFQHFENNYLNFSIDGRTTKSVNGNISAITYGAWNHIMCVLDGTLSGADRMRIYVNGVDESYNANIGTFTALQNASGGLMIGEEPQGAYNPYKGLLDEIAIWSGTDLRNDVGTIYNSGAPSDLSQLATPPSHWWRMGDGDSWDGSKWTINDNIGSYNLDSVNMEEGDRTTDKP